MQKPLHDRVTMCMIDGKSKGEGKWYNFDYALKCSGLEMKYEIPSTSPASLEGNYDCLKGVRSVESNKSLIVYFQGRQQSAFNQLLITARELLSLLKIIRKQKKKIFSNYFHPGNWDFMGKKKKPTQKNHLKIHKKKNFIWWHVKFSLLAMR